MQKSFGVFLFLLIALGNEVSLASSCADSIEELLKQSELEKNAAAVERERTPLPRASVPEVLSILPEVAREATDQIVAKAVLTEVVSEPRGFRHVVSRFKEVMKGVLNLPKVYTRMSELIKKEMQAETLDQYLWSFSGFHHQPQIANYRQRAWNKVSLSEIEPSMVKEMSVEEFVKILIFSMEVEDPTIDYQYESGKAFQKLLPRLGRFMGKDEFQKQASEENGFKACESAWCAEEIRHGNIFANIVERLTGKKPSRDNPNQAVPYGSDIESALKHLGTRQTYEWNASSAYFLLLAHSTGALHEAIANVMRDEVKHLTIMSAANDYIYGNRPWHRFGRLAKNAVKALWQQKDSRSTGSSVKDPAILLAGAMSHLIVEYRIRQYLRTLPLQTLEKIFDAQSELPPLAFAGITPEELVKREEERQRLLEDRRNLSMWTPSQRKEALQQRRFEEEHAEAIQEIIRVYLSNFEGAETPGTMGDTAVLLRIENLNFSSGFDGATYRTNEKRIRTILKDRLRDYQIEHNLFEQGIVAQ